MVDQQQHELQDVCRAAMATAKPARGKLLVNPRGIRTQAEVAAMFGVSRARINQLEQRALVKLVRGLMADPLMRTWWEDCQA